MNWLRKLFGFRKKQRSYTDSERFKLFVISQMLFHL